MAYERLLYDNQVALGAAKPDKEPAGTGHSQRSRQSRDLSMTLGWRDADLSPRYDVTTLGIVPVQSGGGRLASCQPPSYGKVSTRRMW